jgi:hypothetical protein
MFLAIWRVTCPVSYYGLALYLRKFNYHKGDEGAQHLRRT